MKQSVLTDSNIQKKDGMLSIEVHIIPSKDYYCQTFIGKNPFANNMLKSFLDEDSADVVFQVSSAVESPQDGSSPHTLFPAHKLVLQFCAPGSTLATLCEDYDESSPIPVLDTDPQVFRSMLYYVYGGTLTSNEWKAQAKDLLEAADRHGLTNLKLEAEAWYAKYLKITVDNVIETLAYAEKMNCFLLKETATNFILKNKQEVMASDSFENIPETTSVIREILSLATASRQGEIEKKEEALARLSISDLRVRLYDKGMSHDGSREVLIARLLESKENE